MKQIVRNSAAQSLTVGTNTRRLPCFLLLLCSCLLVSSFGCNRGPKIVLAEGVVQFEDGSPVVVGTIETKSLAYEGVQATGKIQRDGSFKLTTFVDGDGAAVGDHQCVVVQFVMTEGIQGHQPSTQGVVNPKHRNYSTSGLKFTVPDEGTKSIKLIVTGVPKLPGERRHTDHKDGEAETEAADK